MRMVIGSEMLCFQGLKETQMMEFIQITFKTTMMRAGMELSIIEKVMIYLNYVVKVIYNI